MNEKKEHLDAIKNNLAECHRRLALVNDSSVSKEQLTACLATSEALVKIQDQQVKALRLAFFGDI